MEINSIEFMKDEDGESKPKKVSVTMTIEEALWIAKLAGKQNGESPHGEIYRALVGDVFNRYWEDGTDGAQRQDKQEGENS